VTPLALLAEEITACRRCPRLVAWRERVAREKRRAYRDEVYWGRPVPGFGDPGALLLIVGLAPGAHGANRTGRMFTGDDSGEFLYAALHRAGLSSRAESRARDDGLGLRGAYIVAAGRCAPPDNKPTPEELSRCAGFLDREIALLPRLRVVLALGAVAFDAYLGHALRRGSALPRPRPAFAHGAVHRDGLPLPLVASYHVSRQNTRTGRRTPAMFDQVLETAQRLAQ
jgi:uracil-DNA glycosylase family 4